jgi:hypothetical protein
MELKYKFKTLNEEVGIEIDNSKYVWISHACKSPEMP